MSYAPRTISYSLELVHPPQAVETQALQRVHNRLYGGGLPSYQSFQVLPQAVVMSNPPERPGMESQFAVFPDRLRFSEHSTGLTTEEFADRVTAATGALLVERPLPGFAIGAVLVRTLINPRNPPQAMEFLASRVLELETELSELGRPVGGLGLRFTLPATPEEPSAFALRIESWPADPRCLWIEAIGQFPGFAPGPGGNSGLAPLGAWIEETYRVATSRAPRFVACFDSRAGL